MHLLVRIIFLFTLLMATNQLAISQVIHVRQGGTGDGSSWEQAFGDLQQALQVATPGLQVWVAAGTYKPTKTSNRTLSFVIPDGVSLYGGFLGSETDLEQRNWEVNKTILSGDIGYPEDPSDNSFSVIVTKGVSRSTRVDGFTITQGMADGKGAYAGPNRCGGGWYNDGSSGESSPTIENCLFLQNAARDGGAFYNYSRNGITRPLIRHSQFVVNKSLLDGGAITNDGSWGESRPEIYDTEFMGNEAVYGACLLNRSQEGAAVPVLENCLFAGNVSYMSGSGIYNVQLVNGNSNSIMTSCRFEGNQASVSGVVSGTSGTKAVKGTSTTSGGIVIRSSSYK